MGAMMREQISRLIDIRNNLTAVIDGMKPESPLSFEDTFATIALIVGHEEHKPGAYAHSPISEYEYFYNNALANYIKSLGDERGHRVRIFHRDHIGVQGAYRDVNTMFMAANFVNCFAIELHFNWYQDASAHGSEVLMCDSLDVPEVLEREFAQIMLDNICNALGTRKRGVKILAKGDGERGWLNVNQVTKAPSILIEPFFGSNSGDCQKAYQHRDGLARAVLNSVEVFIEKNKVVRSGAV